MFFGESLPRSTTRFSSLVQLSVLPVGDLSTSATEETSEEVSSDVELDELVAGELFKGWCPRRVVSPSDLEEANEALLELVLVFVELEERAVRELVERGAAELLDVSDVVERLDTRQDPIAHPGRP